MAAMGLNIIFMYNKIQEPEGGAGPSPQVFLFFWVENLSLQLPADFLLSPISLNWLHIQS